MTITIAGVSLGLPGFDGSSFASYQTIEDALFSLHIQLTFLAQNIDNSLLLYDAFNSEGTSDFVALVIRDGYLEFRYELGSGKLADTLDDVSSLSLLNSLNLFTHNLFTWSTPCLLDLSSATFNV